MSDSEGGAVAQRGPSLSSIAAALSAAGVPSLLLRSPGGPSGEAWVFPAQQIQIAIRRENARASLSVLENTGWRYSWVRSGALRFLPMSYYWWDGGTDLELFWGSPAAPLPAFSLSVLNESLWRKTNLGADGFLQPDPATLLVYLAVQSARALLNYGTEWGHFLHCRKQVVNLDNSRVIASRAGVSRLFARAIAAADNGGVHPAEGPIHDGVLGRAAWSAAKTVQSHIHPHRFRRVLAGAPQLGDTAIRCRVAGVEVVAGPGVFVPTPDADSFVEMSVAFLDGIAKPVVVEAGTGCGAIALALGRARRDAEIYATELSSAAVRGARHNARALGLKSVHFYHGSVLDPLPAQLSGRVDLILANLPFYPSQGYASIGSVPRDTIEGAGDDGLNLLRQLVRDARMLLRPGGRLILQMFARQWEVFAGELADLGYEPRPPKILGAFALGEADLVGQQVRGDEKRDSPR